MIIFPFILALILIVLRLSYGGTAFERLLFPFEEGRLLIMPYLMLVSIFWIGIWVYLNKTQEYKRMGAYILSRLGDKRSFILWLLQKPIFRLATLQVAMYIPMFFTGNDIRKGTIVFISIFLSWVIWGNVSGILLWSGVSIQQISFLMLIIFGLLQYSVVLVPYFSILGFYSPWMTNAPILVVMIKAFIGLLLMRLLYSRIVKYEYIGVDKND